MQTSFDKIFSKGTCGNAIDCSPCKRDIELAIEVKYLFRMNFIYERKVCFHDQDGSLQVRGDAEEPYIKMLPINMDITMVCVMYLLDLVNKISSCQSRV